MPKHVIVDGSNIATEGRDAPSLAQLDEAVQAFIREYEPEIVTVVVDATFPNRIDRRERQVYEDAVVAGEVITPPAGAIGRGDAFLLQIADRSGATVLSNDSFQEFHGDYDWLFDQGRLIGGKPVPHVGWVFMPRTPVRGPTSRRAVSAAKRAQAGAAKAPTTSPASSGASAKRTRRTSKKAPAPAAVTAPPEPMAPVAQTVPADEPPAPPAPPSVPTAYNEVLPFLDFVGAHPVGSGVDAVVENFGSHGAYLRVGDIRAYAPLKNLADPAPRSAKEVLWTGESRRFVVAAIDPPRRGIDLALPGVDTTKPSLAVAPGTVIEAPPATPATSRSGDRRDASPQPTARKRAVKQTGARKSAAKSEAAAKTAPAPPKKSAARKAPAKKASAKQAASPNKAAAKKTAPRRAR